MVRIDVKKWERISPTRIPLNELEGLRIVDPRNVDAFGRGEITRFGERDGSALRSTVFRPFYDPGEHEDFTRTTVADTTKALAALGAKTFDRVSSFYIERGITFDGYNSRFSLVKLLKHRDVDAVLDDCVAGEREIANRMRWTPSKEPQVNESLGLVFDAAVKVLEYEGLRQRLPSNKRISPGIGDSTRLGFQAMQLGLHYSSKGIPFIGRGDLLELAKKMLATKDDIALDPLIDPIAKRIRSIGANGDEILKIAERLPYIMKADDLRRYSMMLGNSSPQSFELRTSYPVKVAILPFDRFEFGVPWYYSSETKGQEAIAVIPEDPERLDMIQRAHISGKKENHFPGALYFSQIVYSDRGDAMIKEVQTDVISHTAGFPRPESNQVDACRIVRGLLEPRLRQKGVSQVYSPSPETVAAVSAVMVGDHYTKSIHLNEWRVLGRDRVAKEDILRSRSARAGLTTRDVDETMASIGAKIEDMYGQDSHPQGYSPIEGIDCENLPFTSKHQEKRAHSGYYVKMLT